MIQNEFVSQSITGFTWARVKAKLTIASLTWPTETSPPTISRSKMRTNETIIGTQANKPVTSKRIRLTTDLICQKSKSQSEVQYCETNTADWKQPTNNFSLRTANERNHCRKRRINKLLRNEFVSELISAVNRAYIQAKLSISKLTRPKENNQPTTSCSKTPKNHYRKT